MALFTALKSLAEYYNLSKEELVARIRSAKKEKNALLLVHNYQRSEIQELADVLGDSAPEVHGCAEDPVGGGGRA